MRFRSYSELRQIDTFEERFEYLKLNGEVGRPTFGFERHLNQKFYRSGEWRRMRSHIIVRDEGCDMAMEGYEIFDRAVIHHMNPMSSDDLTQGNAAILDPEFLITVRHNTHNAIHYGDASLLPKPLVDRKPGDTKLW